MRGFGIIAFLFPDGTLQNVTHTSPGNPVEFNQSSDDFKTPEVFPILCAICFRSSVNSPWASEAAIPCRIRLQVKSFSQDDSSHTGMCWLHFCIVEGRGDALSIYFYSLWLNYINKLTILTKLKNTRKNQNLKLQKKRATLNLQT